MFHQPCRIVGIVSTRCARPDFRDFMDFKDLVEVTAYCSMPMWALMAELCAKNVYTCVKLLRRNKSRGFVLNCSMNWQP